MIKNALKNNFKNTELGVGTINTSQLEFIITGASTKIEGVIVNKKQ